MPRLRPLPPLSLALLLALSPAALAPASHQPTVGFYFWHQPRHRGGPARDGQEYVALLEWSARGWAPERIDVTLDAGWLKGGWTSGRRLRLRVRLQIKVGRFKADPLTGHTDFPAMQAGARWRSVLVKTITVKGFDQGDRIHLVSDLALGRMLDEMWERDEWPLELKAEVWPLSPQASLEPVAGRLRIVGD